ncbi:MAG TPA: pyroglutamyl-peptidase I [Verrucomicrobiae bacterium]|jgi:pyroglutamyl-peptidase|nr:pyroglutamyl-peptidase I [Verrucomicrobiae bacterium]
MKTVLVTGFEPFDGERVNPSALAAEALNGREIAGHRVTGVVLPCVFGKSLAMLRGGIRCLQPELIICAGQRGGRAEIAVESMAINIVAAPIPDNEGNQPFARPVARTGPLAYLSTLPVEAIVAALRDAKLPAMISNCAGTFVCNHVFYGLMRTLHRARPGRGGFIHVPYLPEQAQRADGNPPSMPLEEIVRGLEIAVETSLTAEHNLRATVRANQ